MSAASQSVAAAARRSTASVAKTLASRYRHQLNCPFCQGAKNVRVCDVTAVKIGLADLTADLTEPLDA